MSEKRFNTRIQQKTDTSTNWALATTFIPKAGEIIFYSDLNKIKIGNGVSLLSALSFVEPDVSGKEDKSNKVTSTAGWSATTSDTKYPSEKLVKDSLDGKSDTSHTHSNYIATSEKGANNGVATLGSDGKVPASQLPLYNGETVD